MLNELALIAVIGCAQARVEPSSSLRGPGPGRTIFAAAPTLFVASDEADPTGTRFHAHSASVDAWLVDDGWRLALRGDAHHAVALQMSFVGSHDARPQPLDESPTRVTKMHGADPARWTSSLASTSVRWCEVAPGIDVVLHADGDGFEYDLDLASGADVSDLRIRCAGHDALTIANDGALEITTAFGVLRQPAPWVWTVNPGQVQRLLACRFRLLDDSTFCFELPERDPLLAATIDPALRWCTYLSGESDQLPEALRVQGNGRVLIAGNTASLDFPTTLGAFDPFFSGGVEGFVSCLSADGSHLAWSTFLGGSGDDLVHAMSIESSGDVVIAGETTSPDLPTVPGSYDRTFNGQRDGFVARLMLDGRRLLWSTYLGGSMNEQVAALAITASGATIVSGATQGGGFPTTSGVYDTSFNGGAFAGDVFVTQLASNGAQLDWSTFVGGSSNEGASQLALAPNGDVVFSGLTYSNNFPVTPGALNTTYQAPSQAFVAALNAQGQALRFATFLGGSLEEEIRALAIRPTGEILCGGITLGANFPTTIGAFDSTFAGLSEGFVSELSALGDQLLHSTFCGGSDEDAVCALVLEPGGDVVIAGDTLSTDFTTTPGAYERIFHTSLYGTPFDAFVARLSGDIRGIEYATYFGGGDDDHVHALALDAAGEALFAGQTHGAGLPTNPNVLQSAYNVTATSQGFVARLAFLLHPIPFGVPKLNSSGTGATLRWGGFASVSDHDFRVGVDLAMPLAWTTVFSGTSVVNWPFQGGRLRIRPPLTRCTRFKTDVFGYGEVNVPLEVGMVGSALFFQAWYSDSGDPYGGDLTDALRVFVYP